MPVYPAAVPQTLQIDPGASDEGRQQGQRGPQLRRVLAARSDPSDPGATGDLPQLDLDEGTGLAKLRMRNQAVREGGGELDHAELELNMQLQWLVFDLGQVLRDAYGPGSMPAALSLNDYIKS
jgi:hypothetical protein